jgi:predicted MFS family arabinose efflux permease
MLFGYFNDYFAQDKRFGVERATLLVMAVGAGAIGGGLLGGLWGQRLYNRRPAALPLLSGAAVLAGIPPTLLMINYPAHAGSGPPSMAAPVLLAAVAGFVISIPASNVRAMLINVNAPETRGSVFSLFNLADDLGKGLGPKLISLLVVALGRTAAFNVAACLWIACGAVLVLSARTFPEDERALADALRARGGRAPAPGPAGSVEAV